MCFRVLRKFRLSESAWRFFRSFQYCPFENEYFFSWFIIRVYNIKILFFCYNSYEETPHHSKAHTFQNFERLKRKLNRPEIKTVLWKKYFQSSSFWWWRTVSPMEKAQSPGPKRPSCMWVKNYGKRKLFDWV